MIILMATLFLKVWSGLEMLKKNALNWTLDDFKEKELFPNLKSNNTMFLKDKKKLADQYGRNYRVVGVVLQILERMH